MKKVIVTGISGQDGAYLTHLLLKNGYCVLGIDKCIDKKDLWRFTDLDIDLMALELRNVNLLEMSSVRELLIEYKPDMIFNLASLSSVSESFKNPVESLYSNGQITLNFLEGIRTVSPTTRFFQASSSEMYGNVKEFEVNETSKFCPISPYGTGKLFSHFSTINYREAYNLFTCCGILFNHESPLRSLNFVTRKITDSVAKIHQGKLNYLELGNLDVSRDWGFAGDYVKGMLNMMNYCTADDFLLCTGKQTTLREFVEFAFKCIGINLEWSGLGMNEIGHNKSSGDVLVKVNPDFYRPSDINMIKGDNSKARKLLDWEPKINVEELCNIMVKKDIERNLSLNK